MRNAPLRFFSQRGFYYVLFSQHTVQELGVAAVEKVVGVVDIVGGEIQEILSGQQVTVHIRDVGHGDAAAHMGICGNGVEPLQEEFLIAPESGFGICENGVGQTGCHQNDLAEGILLPDKPDHSPDPLFKMLRGLTAIVHAKGNDQ